MPGERVILGTRGDSSMVKVRWPDACPDEINDLNDAEELGAKWEEDELVTYDLEGMLDLHSYYKNNDYLVDND